MSFLPTPSPVSLSYVAALRGVKSRKPGEEFTYILLNCLDIDFAVCMAACNPEGQFHAIVATQQQKIEADRYRDDHRTGNIQFHASSAAELHLHIQKGTSPLPIADYIYLDETAMSCQDTERSLLLDCATSLAKAGGLVSLTYRPFDRDDGALRFLVREFAPEMNAEQAKEFLTELRKIGAFYFGNNKDILAKLDAAHSHAMPDEFFNYFDGPAIRSKTFDTLVAMRQRGFSYAGDNAISSNYVELSVPSEAQDLVCACQKNYLYESIKDLALNRQIRYDIWCKGGATIESDPSDLFGSFSYGISMAKAHMPSEYRAQGKIINLTSPAYTTLINLMTLMPVTIGDMLSHPSGQGFSKSEILSALQVLVACGLAKPMRGLMVSDDLTNISQPRLVGSFNQAVCHSPIVNPEIRLASTVVGAPITVSARDALVIQALDRAGLANSVRALLPELERITNNPALAARIMDRSNPNSEMAEGMIKEAVSRSMVQWYAYGVLKAA